MAVPESLQQTWHVSSDIRRIRYASIPYPILKLRSCVGKLLIDPVTELRIEKAEATGAIDSGSLLGEGAVAAIILPVCWK